MTMIKTIKVSLYIALLCLIGNVSLFAQPTDHPPIPQIDRTNNASDSRPVAPAAKPTPAVNIDFANKQYYRLSAVKAIDLNHKHTATEMEAYRKEADGEFTKTDIAIDWKAGMWYLKNKNNEGMVRTMPFTVTGNKLTWTNCTKCQDGQYTIIEHTDSQLIMQFSTQDEGQYFVYQYHFTK